VAEARRHPNQGTIGVVGTPLYDRVAAGAPEAARALGEPRDAETALAAMCAEAAAAWPGIEVAAAEVVAAFVPKLAGDDPPALAAAGAIEIHLAIACARGEAAAIAAFDRAYLEVVPLALAGMKLAQATVDDVRAAVRDKLLLADGDRPPRVLAYAGRGRLRGLVQVTATRTAIDRIRLEEREAELPAGRDLAAPANVALSLIKAQYRAAFSDGFRTAVAAASRRDRNLLRLHFLGGVTLEQLAQMYGVHRATVVRWLAAAREAVFAATREHVAGHLRAPADELDEMFDLVKSRVELSVERLLASVEHTR
jgi:RNA polymerase sigma-70 factor (ECF subfamily)